MKFFSTFRSVYILEKIWAVTSILWDYIFYYIAFYFAILKILGWNFVQAWTNIKQCLVSNLEKIYQEIQF